MALPKGKLLTLLVVFAAIGLVTATGAFTTVSADRTATVNVAGDSSALLGIAPYDGPNGNPGSDQTDDEGYAKISGGTVEINLAGYGSAASASGVNKNAVTDFNNVLVITNNGEREVNVSITDVDTADQDASQDDDDPHVTFYHGSPSGTLQGAPGSNSGSLEGGNATLGQGDQLVVSIEVDTTGNVDEDLVDEITINANAT